MRILVIEDEEKTSAYLKKGLEESGYAVDVANDGADGLILALEENYDVIVLDVMLPTMDGWAILKTLRASKATPVLFLTARDDVNDRVRGLELGGDDYLVKPFAFVELLARVRTLARRGPPRESELIKVGDLEIDVNRRKVRRRQAHRPHAARVRTAATARPKAGGSAEPHADRIVCVGHELRQRHQRG